MAALLSPVLWRLNTPDRFDMYSVGILFMQLVFAPIRPDNGLAAFNRRVTLRQASAADVCSPVCCWRLDRHVARGPEAVRVAGLILLTMLRRRLASFDYDLQQWREYQEGKGSKEWVEGFKIMDADGGAAWDLATHVSQTCSQRSAVDTARPARAIAHEFCAALGLYEPSRPLSLSCSASDIITPSFPLPWSAYLDVPELRGDVHDPSGSQEWLTQMSCLQLVAFNPSSRLSAAAALRHPWVTDSALGSTLLKVKQASKRTASALGGERPWLGSVLEGAPTTSAMLRSEQLCWRAAHRVQRFVTCEMLIKPERPMFYRYHIGVARSGPASFADSASTRCDVLVQGRSGSAASRKHSLQRSLVQATAFHRCISLRDLPIVAFSQNQCAVVVRERQ